VFERDALIGAWKLGVSLLALCAVVLAQDPILPGPSLDPVAIETNAESCRDVLTLDQAPPKAQISGFRVLLPIGGTDKRLFGLIPNHRADQFQETYTPLTRHEKFQIARSDSFDWPNYFLLAGYAVQSQIASEGGFKGSGGLKGFGKFYGRSVADQIVGSYVTEAILPSLLHEDPRFFRLGVGSLGHRAFYAASRIFVVRTDRGNWRFNFSEVLGNTGVVALTSLYYPDSQTAMKGGERLVMTLGNDMVSNLLTEFWPDIRRHLPFHRNRSLTQ